MLTLTSFNSNDYQVQIVAPEPYFADDLFHALTVTHDQIKSFLAWADQIQTPSDEARFLQMSKEQFLTGPVQTYVLYTNEQAIGMVDLHNFNFNNHSVEIGYWLSKEFQGNGIITNAVKALIGAIQDELDIHKVIIVVDVENEASRAIPQRLGFTHEAILKDHLQRDGQYHDADIYYLIVD